MIGEGDGRVAPRDGRDVEADGGLLAPATEGGLVLRNAAAAPRVERGAPGLALRRALLLQELRRAETGIGPPGLDERLGAVAIERQPLGLAIRPLLSSFAGPLVPTE